MALILASQSPRRRELLQQIGISNFEICPARGEEKRDPSLSPSALVLALSRQKALEVARSHSKQDTILAADTLVVLRGTVLGKPGNPQEARAMLSALSGQKHQVLTGITLCRGEQLLSEYEETSVYFRPLSGEEIDWYISTGEPMDKAGAYGIQGLGARFIRRIEGDYANVVGLPLCLLCQLLDRLDRVSP